MSSDWIRGRGVLGGQGPGLVNVLSLLSGYSRNLHMKVIFNFHTPFHTRTPHCLTRPQAVRVTRRQTVTHPQAVTRPGTDIHSPHNRRQQGHSLHRTRQPPVSGTGHQPGLLLLAVRAALSSSPGIALSCSAETTCPASAVPACAPRSTERRGLHPSKRSHDTQPWTGPPHPPPCTLLECGPQSLHPSTPPLPAPREVATRALVPGP